MTLGPLLDPLLLARIRDVHELVSDLPGVRVAQLVDDLAQGLLATTGDAVGGELAVEVPHGEPVVHEVELGMRQHLPPDRVQLREEMPPHAVHVHQPDDP